MKIAIVTDAWRPQTNGVVQTLSTTAQTLRALRSRSAASSSRISSARFRVRRIRRSGSRGCRIGGCRSCCATSRPMRSTSRPKERSAWRRAAGACATRLPFTTSYHTQFPEYVRARAPIPLALSYAHLRRFHSRCRAHDGRDADDAAAAGSARLSQHRALDARRRRRAVQAAATRVSRSAAADLRCTWGASRSRRTSKRSSRSICPARRSSSATGRRALRSRRSIPTRSSSATSSARSWRRISPPRMCSCFRAAPIRSAWCCSRRWRAACRSRRIR